ncbi:MAG TPA: galactokinase family protein [Acidobacteriota bacterium]|nr:galactokinase family protein [Acidobacteriota bacterium]
MTDRLAVSAPGRICLFGEHQDYLGLDVVAAAVDLRITISGVRRADRTFVIDLPDMCAREEIALAGELPYTGKRDYLRSGLNVLRRAGADVPSGWDVVVRGTIPINAGTASSSALVVAWDRFLLEAGGDPRAARPGELAELGFLTEVAEFREPGGKMDHYAAAFGRVIRLEFGEPLTVVRLDAPPGDFVLGDSLEKKDTTGTLGSVKDRVLRGVGRIRELFPEFSLKASLTPELERAIERFEPAVRDPLLGAFSNRDLTAAGVAVFAARPFDDAAFGELLSREHAVLRDALGVSTRKLDRMLDAALGAGALGGKLNGSGGGGCMFAYAPSRAGDVAEAVEKAGGKAYIIRVDEGARVEG